MIKANEDKSSANPLFEAWINEWRQEALARNSPAVHSFRKALASLKQYPLRLETGKDCHILQNFGHKLCGMIDKKLQQYKEVQNLPVNNAVSLSHLNNGIETKSLSFGNLKNDKCSSSDFQPLRVESSLILTSQMLSKQVVNLKNTVICDINGINDSEAYNFFKDKHATNYVKTRDNTTIERPGLVKSLNSSEDSNIFCEEIVEPDMKLATQVTPKTKDHQLNTDKCNDVKTASQKVKCSPADNANNEMFFWSKNFNIVLLVDIQETCGAKIKSQSCHIGTELNNIGISFETRSLKVGDFTWIARCRATSKELILPYIVERKRIDDLSASIIDGRYKEQKFRLKQTGVKNIIYLIESYGPNHGIIPVPSLLQASANLLIQDNFIVKFTRDRKDSMHYLARMTNIITKIYQNKELKSCEAKNFGNGNVVTYDSLRVSLINFTKFNSAAKKTKSFTVREMFMRQLLQLKGISVDKAMAITNVYPTPKTLTHAFKNEDDNLLANIPLGTSKSRIGPVISRNLSQFYSRPSFNWQYKKTQMLKCHSCSYVFADMKVLKTHETKHTNQNFKCEICYTIIKSRNHFTRHLKKRNFGKRIKCYIFQKEFKRDTHLKRHIKIHNQHIVRKILKIAFSEKK